ncbi:MAG: alkaline phosphatase D family protein [Woeseiaceae bacterium]|nr:alkaline phosphatase D family protein [Woeseiaceae bacterium]
MKRRSVLKLFLGGVAAVLAGCVPKSMRPVDTPRFDHSVASGDPLSDRVILWTRIAGVSVPTKVRWEISRDAAFTRVVSSGDVSTDASRDYTVKVDAAGLPAGERLYFRFEAGGTWSPVGRTRTAPTGAVEAANFAVVSCSNHPYGYFHVYRDIAQQEDLDAVIHLGDYIYEYGPGGYATEHAEALGRVPDPPYEITSLSDYRTRYAQYRSDPDLQAAHQNHPFVVVWDDHELTNDAWQDGAQNHDLSEGDWATRRDAAVQAYLEWMPIRAEARGGKTKIFRRFDFGDLLSLIMLDTRLYGRDIQPDVGEDTSKEAIIAAMEDPERRLLGRDQEAWLDEQLKASGDTRWQMIGQQLMVMPNVSPDLEPLLDLESPALLPREQLDHYVAVSKGNPPMILDTWNGYPLARQDFLASLAKYASNPVVISGDLHTSMAGELTPIGMERPVAAEFMTTSVTSPGFAEYLPEAYPGAVRDGAMAINPHIRYMDTDHRGWLKMSLDPEECRGEWRLIDRLRDSDYEITLDQTLAVRAGRIHEGMYEPD